MAGVTAAAGTVFFSFIGLDTIATAGEEVRNPTRDVPIGILAALVIVTVFYMLVADRRAWAPSRPRMFAGQEAGLAVILQNVTGKAWPALVLSAGAVISVFSRDAGDDLRPDPHPVRDRQDGLIPQDLPARSTRAPSRR